MGDKQQRIKHIRRIFPAFIAKKLSKHIEIALIDEETSRILNARYRKENKPTNVLSFRYGHAYGEILLCTRIIRKEAKEQGNSYAFQMTWMIVHGMLHLAGVHHEKSIYMKKRAKNIEEKILETLTNREHKKRRR